MSKSKFTCEKCGRGFSMAAHLARHLSGSHGVAPANKKPGSGRKPGRPGRRAGRMPAVVAKFNMSSMSADELAKVILAARAEVERRIADLQGVIG